MRKIFAKIDFVLFFRWSLSAAMIINGYIQNDYVSASFGGFLAVYSFIGAKYKIGCGYNGCGYTPRYESKYAPKQSVKHIDFTEIK